MWQILNVEPVYGVCSICRSHECGIVDDKHQWIHTEALDDTRENIVIGYKCVKLFAENFGISKQVVEKLVPAEPTEEQILIALKYGIDHLGLELKFNEHIVPTLPLGISDPPGIVIHNQESKDKTSHRGKATPKK